MQTERVNHEEDVSLQQSARSTRGEIQCRRTGRTLALSEHKSCTYCCGRADDIANGQNERFCNFELGCDPIVFGIAGGAAAGH